MSSKQLQGQFSIEETVVVPVVDTAMHVVRCARSGGIYRDSAPCMTLDRMPAFAVTTVWVVVLP